MGGAHRAGSRVLFRDGGAESFKRESRGLAERDKFLLSRDDARGNWRKSVNGEFIAGPMVR